MLEIRNLTADVGGKTILNGIDLVIPDGEVHAIMGPNGAGKSTLSYVLSGREGYTVTGGSVTLNGQDILAMAPHERAAAGLFLAFQYPVEIPGVQMTNFLKTAVNAQRKQRGEPEMEALEFLKLKCFVVMHVISDKDITEKNFVKKVAAVFQSAKPLISFLNTAVD